jgi:hypothetical protein
MSTKQTLLTLVVLVAALGAAFWYWSSYTPAATDGQVQHILKGEQIGEGWYLFRKEAPGYTIEAKYPNLVSLKDPAAAQQAQLKLEMGVEAYIKGFEVNVADMLTPEEIQRLNEMERRYELGMEYKEYMSDNFVSYLYLNYEDTGGAHPNSYYSSFVFNQEGAQVELNDLFVAGSDQLERISLLSSIQVTAEMKKRLEMDDVSGSIFAEGLAANAENFQNFVIDGDTLAIFFPPYQVAAYAAGTFEVRIPLSDFKDILKPGII